MQSIVLARGILFSLTLTRAGEAGLIATFHLPPDWREGEGGAPVQMAAHQTPRTHP